MALTRLSNERWGFTFELFRVRTDEPGWAPSSVLPRHGRCVGRSRPAVRGRALWCPGVRARGVQLALLDEAMAWAAIAITERFAVTGSFTSTFHHPLRVDKQYRLEAAIDQRTESTLRASARIIDDQDRPWTSASATLVVLSAAQATDAGAVIDESTQRWTR